MYKQVLDPVSQSLGLTSIFAVLPLLVLFVLLGVLRMKAQWAALLTLAVAILVALIVYSMPVGQATDAALEGAVFGFWPIMWIVINALWIFNMTEATGNFAVLRRAFSTVSDDQRVQVVVIAFCFGALLEALAGFGTPVAICGVMLVGLGLKPVQAAAARWSPTPHRSPSARSRSPSPRSPRSPGCRFTTSARWSAARPHSWP
jgi:lactate permease